jgi:MFS family permease
MYSSGLFLKQDNKNFPKRSGICFFPLNEIRSSWRRQTQNTCFTSKFIIKIQPWLVVFAAASFYFLVNSAMNLSVITPYLITKFHFTAVKISFLFACYYYSNIIFVFFAGIVLDKASVKKVLMISFVVVNCSILLFALTNSFVLMVLARLALGLVGSFSLLSCFKLIKRWFPPEKVAFVTGIIITYASFGTLFSQSPLILAIEQLGWRSGLLLNFWLGILLFIFATIFVQDFPANIQQDTTQQQALKNQTSVWVSIRKTIMNYQNWLIGLYSSLFSLPGLFFGANWGIPYFQQAGLTKEEGACIINAIVVGAMIGFPFIGCLSDRFHSRKKPLIVCGFFIIAILLIVTYVKKMSLLTYILLFFLFGLTLSSQAVIFPFAAEHNPPFLVGSATGFVATLTTLSGIYMPFLGWIIDCYSKNHKHLIIDYHPVMLILIGMVIISMFLLLFISETNGKQQQYNY